MHALKWTPTLKLFSLFWKEYMLTLTAQTHVQDATELLKDGIDLVTDADTALLNLLSYPLDSTLARW